MQRPLKSDVLKHWWFEVMNGVWVCYLQPLNIFRAMVIYDDGLSAYRAAYSAAPEGWQSAGWFYGTLEEAMLAAEEKLG